MRSWWFVIALTVAACGGTKKAASSPGAGSDSPETEPRDDETGARDEARPDDEDDMPSKAMGDPCNE